MTALTFSDLERRSILLLGFGSEGQATYAFMRRQWPHKAVTVCDRRPLEELPPDIVDTLRRDPAVTLRFGPAYLDALAGADVIVKTPGIPATTVEIATARAAGATLTSHAEIFMHNYPRQRVIGVTGTKGKSTTSALIHHLLSHSGVRTHLTGNIGVPPLLELMDGGESAIFVVEFSSHQLAEITCSPHIAVLLNIVPEHLDYYAGFDDYVAAKENIARYQTSADYLVFSGDYPIPSGIAGRSPGRGVACRTTGTVEYGCRVRGNHVVWADAGVEHVVAAVDEIPLRGRFNLQNVMAAAAAAILSGVEIGKIREAIHTFQPLPHRLEPAGIYQGIAFYDDSIATVPEAALGAVEALGPAVQTLILGGYDRGLEFDGFAAKLPDHIRTVILFPPSGLRIWDAICRHRDAAALPEAFVVDSMEEAVRIAYSRTDHGRICLLSPASPSFGQFRDYRERGDSFKTFVEALGADNRES